MLEIKQGEAESLKVPVKCKNEFIVLCLDHAKPKAKFLDGTFLKASNQKHTDEMMKFLLFGYLVSSGCFKETPSSKITNFLLSMGQGCHHNNVKLCNQTHLNAEE